MFTIKQKKELNKKMIQKIWVLQEDIEHEIRTMLREAEEELHKQEIDYVKDKLKDETITPEEKEEFEEILESLLKNE